jgi:hypothetical protein
MPQDLDLHLAHPILASQPHQLGTLIRDQTRRVPGFHVGQIHPATPTGLRDSEIPRDLSDWPRLCSSEIDGPLTEMWRMRLRHRDSSRDEHPTASK